MGKKTTLGSLAIGLILFTLSGCSGQPKPLYTYGDYSESYYNSKKNVSEESILKLQKSIEYAIENADKSRSKRVAPGMYANLGYLYLLSGESAKAIESFNKEKMIYPESSRFMDRMIRKVEVAQGDNDE